jgi:MacB-like periplasmic core domain
VTLRCALPKTSAYALDLGVQRALNGNSVRRWSLKQGANRFVEGVRERLKQTPGVESAAAVATALPLAGLFYGDQFRIEGQSSLTPEQARKQSGVYADVSQDYFRTMGIRLRQGRDFNERDTAESRPVAVVSETMARSLWPNEATVVGKRFLRRGQTAWYEVVGVVDDVRTRANGDIIAEAYFPQAQTPASITYPDHLMTVRLTLYFVVRTRSQPKRMAVAIRNAIREVDKDQPVDQLRAMDEVVSDAFGPWRTVMLLLCLFAAVATPTPTSAE